MFLSGAPPFSSLQLEKVQKSLAHCSLDQGDLWEVMRFSCIRPVYPHLFQRRAEVPGVDAEALTWGVLASNPSLQRRTGNSRGPIRTVCLGAGKLIRTPLGSSETSPAAPHLVIPWLGKEPSIRDRSGKSIIWDEKRARLLGADSEVAAAKSDVGRAFVVS